MPIPMPGGPIPMPMRGGMSRGGMSLRMCIMSGWWGSIPLGGPSPSGPSVNCM